MGEEPPATNIPDAVPETTAAPAAAGPTDQAAPATIPSSAGVVVLPPTTVTAAPSEPAAPPPRRVLVVGDENFLFTTGLQEAYPEVEFTTCSVLNRANLEAYNFEPMPASIRGRIRHGVDPCRLGRSFQHTLFDDIMLFLPGLGFSVPRELGTPDRPLFAYRTHLLTFHIIRHSKCVLKGEGNLHLVWPDENRLMTSPCGAAGIEMVQLVSSCGCKLVEPVFDMDKVRTDNFWPFILGEVPAELPEWISGSRIHSFTHDKSPIPVPLSVALLLHPDVSYVCIKDASPDAPTLPPGQIVLPLRTGLIHEANVRKERLKEIYGPKEGPDDKPDVLAIIPEPAEEDSLLMIPMEIFMTSFDDLPHMSALLKFYVCDEQPQTSIASLDVLDPRLPTRIARPPPKPQNNPLIGIVNSMQNARKRARPVQEEWGNMKFYCPLTKICTATADNMRKHLSGKLYKKMAASTPGWEDGQEKKNLIADLEEEEEREKKTKTSHIGQPAGKGKGGKTGKCGKGGKGGK